MAKESNVQHQHTPGPLKQQNKSHKHGRHKTKGMLENIAKGRINAHSLSRKDKKIVGKMNRRNQAKQHRANKREEVLQQKRKIGKLESPPHAVCIIPLSASCTVEQVLENMHASNDDTVITTTPKCKLLTCPHMKQWFSFYLPKYGDLYGILDAAKGADIIIFLMEANSTLDAFGEKCLSCVVAQGIPTCFHVLQGMQNIHPKKVNSIKKNFNKLVAQRFPKDKIHTLDTPEEANQLLRVMANHHYKAVFYKDMRAHVAAHTVHYEEDVEEKGCGTLKVTGYVKGRALSANQLVYLPGFGSFQINQIDSCHDPSPGRKQKTKTNSMNVDDDTSAMDEDIKILQKADPVFQEALEGEVIPDPMEGEQTWPTEEELNEAEVNHEQGIVKRVPKGTSDYQSAWIIDNEEDDDGDDDNDSVEEMMQDDNMIEEIQDESGNSADEKEFEDDEYETISVTTETQDSRYDEKFPAVDITELEKARAERENELFPDEIDTPFHVSARVRFQKYRGLKSFRTSPWDPKENLPSDYARIFQFENFDRTKRKVLKTDDDEGALPGWYVTVHVKNVPKNVAEYFSAATPLVMFGVLPHEQKMSVMHFVIKRHPSCMDTIKAKEPLVFQCGYKRFTASPLFSQHTTGNKFKMERFLPKEGVVVATVYASVTFPPCPVLVFKLNMKTNKNQLVATGSLYQVNPNRIVTKKIVLSGLPFKVNKKSAVIRHMFFTRDDIQWFKPVELWTKYGRRGHIKEPLGTHGHMKCVFDGPIKSQDTVCMNLYKRVFPKWVFNENVEPCPIEEAGKDEEMVTQDQ